MKIETCLQKMTACNVADKGKEVDYFLNYGNEKIFLNSWIGKQINFTYTGLITCLECKKKTPKSFNQGYCYRCFVNSPINSPCIIRPELCEAHLGKGRDIEWEKTHHLHPHYVYLSYASGCKVGVTRSTQIPTRWIDQGAVWAMIIAETPNRYLAGCIEVELKTYFDDKTNWRRMLMSIDKKKLLEFNTIVSKAKDVFPDEYKQYFFKNQDVYKINYPVETYPFKVKSINLDKTPNFELKLKGIKGQYMIFENNFVINIRKYGGYHVVLDIV